MLLKAIVFLWKLTLNMLFVIVCLEGGSGNLRNGIFDVESQKMMAYRNKYELLKPSETVICKFKRLKRGAQEICQEWENRQNKLISHHENAKLHTVSVVKTYLNAGLRSSIPPAIFASHCSFRLLFIPVDAVSSSRRTIHLFWKHQKLAWSMDLFRSRRHFRTGNPCIAWKISKFMASYRTHFE